MNYMIKRAVLVLGLLLSAAYAMGSYGDNVAGSAQGSDAPDTSKLINVAANRGQASDSKAFSSFELAPMLESDNGFSGPFWRPLTEDPETEAKIYEYIVQRYRNVPERDARQIAASIVSSSKTNFVDPYLVTALIERESRFNKNAVSYHGAQGLGQIMPINHKNLGITNAFDIQQNVSGTTIYLRHLMDRWSKEADRSLELTLASYNEGPNAIAKQNKTWKDKTNPYIQDIVAIYHRFIGPSELEAKTN